MIIAGNFEFKLEHIFSKQPIEGPSSLFHTWFGWEDVLGMKRKPENQLEPKNFAD